MPCPNVQTRRVEDIVEAFDKPSCSALNKVVPSETKHLLRASGCQAEHTEQAENPLVQFLKARCCCGVPVNYKLHRIALGIIGD